MKYLVAAMWVALQFYDALPAAPGGGAQDRSLSTHIEVQWDFDAGLEGWGNSTAEEMDAELYSRGGELRGKILGKAPHFDSPVFDIHANDRHYVVVRMSYRGAGARGGVLVRTSVSMPEDSQAEARGSGRDAWTAADTAIAVDFQERLVGDGSYRIYAAPLWRKIQGTIGQLRLRPVLDGLRHEAFSVDWVRIVKAPRIFRVEGCIDKYFRTEHLGADRANRTSVMMSERRADGHYIYRGSGEGFSAVTTNALAVNADEHRFYSTSFERLGEEEFPFATTYNCLRKGGERILITGTNLGVEEPGWSSETPSVTVGGRPCTGVELVELNRRIACTLPPCIACDSPERLDRLDVVVYHADTRVLFDSKPYLSYAVPPPRPTKPTLSNIAARSIDLSWLPPANYWDAVTITGYVIQRARYTLGPGDDPDIQVPHIAEAEGGGWDDAMVVVGNVTTTTLIGLRPDTLYRFRVAALVEDQKNLATPGSGGSPPVMEWLQLDLYGRRPHVNGAVIGSYSEPSESIATLRYDFRFNAFDANATLNHGASDPRHTRGPSGNEHGEGHYGLRFVGDASIASCNSSHSCCDSYNDGDSGSASCRVVCTALLSVDADYLDPTEPDSSGSQNTTVGDGDDKRPAETNLHDNGMFVGWTVPEFASFYNVSGTCGGELRLTGSHARQTGAAWYPRKMNVREGFDTTFRFRISSPSQVCQIMDDVRTRCRARGSDGFAFVVQNDVKFALGDGGRALGYGGLRNSLAVEFDTHFNPEALDAFENQVSVMTRGHREANSANHSYELGGSSGVIDLTDGEHVARVTYNPVFEHSALYTDTFSSTPHASFFLSNAAFSDGAQADWGTGLGTLSVYVDDLSTPLFVTAVNFATTLKLDSGRAWVGFTAATGDNTWQVHDILAWQFTSSRRDLAYYPPPVVNGQGAARCSEQAVKDGVCTHF